MKKDYKIIFILIFLLFMHFKSITYATSTPSATKKSNASGSSDLTEKLKQIEVLKDKIATTVAKIREKDKTAIFGKVKIINNNQITLISDGKESNILYSEDTIVYNFPEGVRAESKTKNIKSDDTISVFGYLGDKKDTVSAKYIYIEKQKTIIGGVITNKDNQNFTLTVNSENKEYKIDVEKTTKTFIFDKNKKILIKGGFSQIENGGAVLVFATSANTMDTFSADKLYSVFINQTDKTASPTPSITKVSDSKSITISPTPNK